MGRKNKEQLTASDFEQVVTSYYLKKVTDAITPCQIEFLRDRIQIGDFLEFKRTNIFSSDYEVIFGVVKAKYTHIFQFEDGRTYQWKEVLMGDPKLKSEIKQLTDTIQEFKMYDISNDRNYYPYREAYLVNGGAKGKRSYKKSDRAPLYSQIETAKSLASNHICGITAARFDEYHEYNRP